MSRSRVRSACIEPGLADEARQGAEAMQERAEEEAGQLRKADQEEVPVETHEKEFQEEKKKFQSIAIRGRVEIQRALRRPLKIGV
jgi:hypothetical protein